MRMPPKRNLASIVPVVEEQSQRPPPPKKLRTLPAPTEVAVLSEPVKR